MGRKSFEYCAEALELNSVPERVAVLLQRVGPHLGTQMILWCLVDQTLECFVAMLRSLKKPKESVAEPNAVAVRKQSRPSTRYRIH